MAFIIHYWKHKQVLNKRRKSIKTKNKKQQQKSKTTKTKKETHVLIWGQYQPQIIIIKKREKISQLS